MSYDQNMNESSIWWGTIYAERNLTAMERESENQYKPGKLPDIPAVAWWQIGNDVKSVFSVNSFLILILLLKVVATTEYPGGVIVDPHNLIAFDDYPFSNGDWLGEGWNTITNPSHEAFGGDGVIWSTVAVMKVEANAISDKLLSRVKLQCKECKFYSTFQRDWYTKLNQ